MLLLLLVEREEIGGVVRLSLRLFYVFLVFFLFLIATSRHNTSNFHSHPAAAFSSLILRTSSFTGYLPLPRHFIFIITLFISIITFLTKVLLFSDMS
jgi:hypothetical protein